MSCSAAGSVTLQSFHDIFAEGVEENCVVASSCFALKTEVMVR